jgi:hypothetical protein
MKIDEYGNFTTIYFENYEDITIPGIHHFELGSEFKLADGHSVIISGYTNLRHRAEKASFGKLPFDALKKAIQDYRAYFYTGI